MQKEIIIHKMLLLPWLENMWCWLGLSNYGKFSKDSATIFSEFRLLCEIIFWGTYQTTEGRQKVYTSNKSSWSKGLKNDIKLKTYPICFTQHRFINKLKLDATIFWGHLIFEDLQYVWKKGAAFGLEAISLKCRRVWWNLFIWRLN